MPETFARRVVLVQPRITMGLLFLTLKHTDGAGASGWYGSSFHIELWDQALLMQVL